jgi:hypothetical protein
MIQNDLCGANNFESFEQDIYTWVMALECELVSEELGRYDLMAKEIEVEAKVYRRNVSLPGTYLMAAGKVSVMYNDVDNW